MNESFLDNQEKNLNLPELKTNKSYANDHSQNTISYSNISATSWSVLDSENGEIIGGKEDKRSLEIASLTKIMTSFLALKLANLYQINIHTTFLTISERAAKIGGTSSCLRPGYRFILIDLLHGMLLPSGNDSAIAIAEYFGNHLLNHNEKNITKDSSQKFLVRNIFSSKETKTAKNGINQITMFNFKYRRRNKDPVLIFVSQMNKIARALGMINTNFNNPTGLSDKGNTSSATDIGRLVFYASKNYILNAIVKKQHYLCAALDKSDHLIPYKWNNTNLLLQNGFDGFKTGTTNTAGACLVATCKILNEIPIIIVILHSKSTDLRWKDAQLLRRWATSKLISINSKQLTKCNKLSMPKRSKTLGRQLMKLKNVCV